MPSTDKTTETEEKAAPTEEAVVPTTVEGAVFYRSTQQVINSIPFGKITKDEVLCVSRENGHYLTLVAESGSWERILGKVVVSLDDVEMASVNHHIKEQGYCVLESDEFTILDNDGAESETVRVAKVRRRTR